MADNRKLTPIVSNKLKTISRSRRKKIQRDLFSVKDPVRAFDHGTEQQAFKNAFILHWLNCNPSEDELELSSSYEELVKRLEQNQKEREELRNRNGRGRRGQRRQLFRPEGGGAGGGLNVRKSLISVVSPPPPVYPHSSTPYPEHVAPPQPDSLTLSPIEDGAGSDKQGKNDKDHAHGHAQEGGGARRSGVVKGAESATSDSGDVEFVPDEPQMSNHEAKDADKSEESEQENRITSKRTSTRKEESHHERTITQQTSVKERSVKGRTSKSITATQVSMREPSVKERTIQHSIGTSYHEPKYNSNKSIQTTLNGISRLHGQSISPQGKEEVPTTENDPQGTFASNRDSSISGARRSRRVKTMQRTIATSYDEPKHLTNKSIQTTVNGVSALHGTSIRDQQDENEILTEEEQIQQGGATKAVGTVTTKGRSAKERKTQNNIATTYSKPKHLTNISVQTSLNDRSMLHSDSTESMPSPPPRRRPTKGGRPQCSVSTQEISPRPRHTQGRALRHATRETNMRARSVQDNTLDCMEYNGKSLMQDRLLLHNDTILSDTSSPGNSDDEDSSVPMIIKRFTRIMRSELMLDLSTKSMSTSPKNPLPRLSLSKELIVQATRHDLCMMEDVANMPVDVLMGTNLKTYQLVTDYLREPYQCRDNTQATPKTNKKTRDRTPLADIVSNGVQIESGNSGESKGCKPQGKQVLDVLVEKVHSLNQQGTEEVVDGRDQSDGMEKSVEEDRSEEYRVEDVSYKSAVSHSRGSVRLHDTGQQAVLEPSALEVADTAQSGRVSRANITVRNSRNIVVESPFKDTDQQCNEVEMDYVRDLGHVNKYQDVSLKSPVIIQKQPVTQNENQPETDLSEIENEPVAKNSSIKRQDKGRNSCRLTENNLQLNNKIRTAMQNSYLQSEDEDVRFVSREPLKEFNETRTRSIVEPNPSINTETDTFANLLREIGEKKKSLGAMRDAGVKPTPNARDSQRDSRKLSHGTNKSTPKPQLEFSHSTHMHTVNHTGNKYDDIESVLTEMFQDTSAVPRGGNRTKDTTPDMNHTKTNKNTDISQPITTQTPSPTEGNQMENNDDKSICKKARPYVLLKSIDISKHVPEPRSQAVSEISRENINSTNENNNNNEQNNYSELSDHLEANIDDDAVPDPQSASKNKNEKISKTPGKPASIDQSKTTHSSTSRPKPKKKRVFGEKAKRKKKPKCAKPSVENTSEDDEVLNVPPRFEEPVESTSVKYTEMTKNTSGFQDESVQNKVANTVETTSGTVNDVTTKTKGSSNKRRNNEVTLTGSKRNRRKQDTESLTSLKESRSNDGSGMLQELPEKSAASFSVDSGDGLRRSTRTRRPPVDILPSYQHVIIEYTDKKPKDGFKCPTAPAPRTKRKTTTKNNPKVNIIRQDVVRPADARTEVDAEITSSTQDNLPDIDSLQEATNLARSEDVVSAEEMHDKSSKVHFLENIIDRANDIRAGKLVINENSEQHQWTKHHSLHFVVYQGEGKVKLLGKTFTIEAENYFSVPRGHEYCIKNSSNSDALVLMYLASGSHMRDHACC